MTDPYSRVKGCPLAHCKPRSALKPFRLDGVPYCPGCGRSVVPREKRYRNFGDVWYTTIWLHAGPIFSTSRGC